MKKYSYGEFYFPDYEAIKVFVRSYGELYPIEHRALASPIKAKEGRLFVTREHRSAK